MTLAAISADIRARAGYLPMCPLCSFVSANILVRPGIRTVTFPATRDYPDGRTVVKIMGCCLYSTPNHNYFETETEAAAWWVIERQQSIADIATDNRRRSCLEKLAAANLEPITHESTHLV